MSARLSVDFLLLEARDLLIGTNNVSSDLQPQLQIIPDVDLAVSLWDTLTKDTVVVTAHADWVAGYPAVGGGIAVAFLALHARTPAAFSGMYVQLVTALGKPPAPNAPYCVR